MQISHLRFAVVVCALTLAVLIPIQALNAAEALINARSYHPLPEGEAVEIEVLDDTEFNLSVADALTRAIHERGLETRAPARLILSFETLDQYRVRRPKGDLGEISVGTRIDEDLPTEAGTEVDARLRLNMWSSTGDSILSRRPGADTTEGAFIIIAVLYDRTEQRRIWEAEVGAPAQVRNDAAQTERLVGLVAKHLGATMRNEGVAY